MSRPALSVNLADITDKKVRVYEHEAGTMRIYQRSTLRSRGKLRSPPTNPSAAQRTDPCGVGDSPTILKIPVPKWTMRVGVVLPGDEQTGEGSIQIASVGIPLMVAVRRSVFGQDENIYATGRCC